MRKILVGAGDWIGYSHSAKFDGKSSEIPGGIINSRFVKKSREKFGTDHRFQILKKVTNTGDDPLEKSPLVL